MTSADSNIMPDAMPDLGKLSLAREPDMAQETDIAAEFSEVYDPLLKGLPAGVRNKVARQASRAGIDTREDNEGVKALILKATVAYDRKKQASRLSAKARRLAKKTAPPLAAVAEN